MGRLAAVLWDMDGTLLDSEKLWDIALYDLADHLGGVLLPETRHALIGSSGPDAMAILFDALRLDDHPDAVRAAGDWLEDRITGLFREGVPWRPGAKDALGLAREAQVSTGLVTNTKRTLAEVALDTLGREFFDTSVCGDEVQRGKPAPDPYLRAAELLGVDPGDCLAVEDSPTGAAAAAAAGCRVLVIPCEIPVPTAPGMVLRDSLVGLTTTDLHAYLG